jgi:putative nucleotidyltransferase with HDIG domain
MTRRERLLLLTQAGAFLAAAALAAGTMRTSDWEPFSLLAVLGAGTIVSGVYPIEIKGVRATGCSIGIVLAAALLGPAPAALIGVLSQLAMSARRRPPLQTTVCNMMIFTIFPLAAGFLMRLASDEGWTQGTLGLPATVFVAFLLANFLNFLILELDLKITAGHHFRHDLRDVYLPVVPVEIASAVLTASLAAIYLEVGMGFTLLLGVVGLVFQYLLHLTFVARRRGEQLEKRGQELATLQFGLLTTVIKTLNLRDKMTARHSAAVARYAREISKAIGMSEEEQDFVHTAGLLHDIGKFVFPDSILFADRKLSDADFEIVKSHPQAGAELVASIEGYGPVADVILAHHERVDGRGYPFGVAGDDIPIAARMIAIADTYDVMTSRDSYRRPVSSEDAITELRRVSGSQLDGRLVEVFIELVRSTNLVFRHSDDADFERELAFDRRVREYASPRVAA